MRAVETIQAVWPKDLIGWKEIRIARAQWDTEQATRYEKQGIVVEENAKMQSLDARSKGQPRPLLLKGYRELERPRSTIPVGSA